MGFLNSDKVIVGYDLGNDFTQISFSFSETGDVETLSQAANAEHYNTRRFFVREMIPSSGCTARRLCGARRNATEYRLPVCWILPEKGIR